MNNDPIIFGKALKELRLSRCLSLTAVSRVSGIDLSRLSKIENGRIPCLPDEVTLETLAKALELNQEDSDLLHYYANRIPYDVYNKLMSHPRNIYDLRRWLSGR